MAKFKVLKKFRDKETKKIYEVGSVIDMTVKRSEEVSKNLDDSFLERLEEKKDDKTPEDGKPAGDKAPETE